MKTPEFGDIIVTNNDQHWVCADSKTIIDKIGSDPMVGYAEDPIKAYSADLTAFSFMTWKSVDSSVESWGFGIKEVIPAPKKGRTHADIIKAWADGADVEQYSAGKWTFVSDPLWREDEQYRVKTSRQLAVRITQDGRMVLCNDGNLLLTFDLSGKLVSAEVK